MVSQSLSALLSLCSLAFCALPQLDGSFYLHELDYLASLGSRLTGSANQALLINHIRRELQNLGFHVYSDNYNFQYQRPPSDPINLTINGESVPASGFVPYAGVTDAEGVEGRLVEIEVPESYTESPDWSLAAGNIALVNLYNTPLDGANRFPVWHGSSKWSGTIPGIPATNPGVRNISLATEAGVKGIIYNWKNITSFNAYAQYGPFKQNDQGTPAIYVTDQALRQVEARNGSRASFTSNGAMINDTHTETIWVVIEGTNLKNETVLVNTHTDGCNVVQENGYIPMLARARELAHSPPCRTTILLFLSGHLHTSGFTDKGRITERWLEDHPDLWAESSGSGKKAVFGSCVEHLGAAHWKEDLPNELYYPTGAVEDELLYASSQKLADMIGGFWKGADPAVLRIVNPHAMSSEQSGEGLAYLWHDIPEVSICTAPDWLLKVFPPTFDQMSLVDVQAVRRQSESLLKLWGAVDHLSSEDIRHL